MSLSKNIKYTSEAGKLLAANESDFLAKFKALKSKTTKQKKDNRITQQRFSWKNEMTKLLKLYRQYESEWFDCISSLSLNDPNADQLFTQVTDTAQYQYLTVSLFSSICDARKSQSLFPAIKELINTYGEELETEYNDLLQDPSFISLSWLSSMESSLVIKDEDPFVNVEDSMAVDEYRIQLTLMKHRHIEVLAEMKAECDLKVKAMGIKLEDRFGGWNRRDHDIFKEVIRVAQTAGKTRAQYFTELKTLLRGHSPSDISKHDDWWRLVKSGIEQRKAKSAMFDREVKMYISDCFAAIETSKQEEQIQMQKLFEQASFESKRLDIKLNLDEMRKDQLEHQIRAHEFEVKNAPEKVELESILQAKKSSEEEKKKQAIEKYQQDQKIQRDQILQSQFQEQQCELEEKKKMIPLNRERAKYREEKLQQKLVELRQRTLETNQIIQEKEAHMMAVASSLAPKVASDADRIRSTTKSFDAYVNTRESQPMFSTSGYQDETLMKDKRFAASIALREAGVIDLAYAKEALRSIPAYKPASRAFLTSEQLMKQKK